jgi:exopolysaccharide production protein ExoZ
VGAERRTEIQWLRAIAATEVAICHSDLVTKHFSSYHLAESWWHRGVGGIGVEIFFMVSGYVICMTAASHKTGGAFLLSRIRRIYPMYWIFTSLVVVAYLVNSDWHLSNFDPSPLSLLRSYFILPQPGFPILGVGWTLEHEMMFYVLVAIVMLFWSMRAASKQAMIWLLAAIGFLGCLHGPQSQTSVLAFHFFSPYMLAFGFGWLMRYVDGMRLAEQVPLIGLFLAVGAAGYCFGSEYGAHLVVRLAAAAAVFVLFLLARRLFAADNAVNRFGWKFGDASYSIYLVHWFVLSAMGKAIVILQPDPTAAELIRLAGVALSVAVGFAAWALLEKPVDRWLRGELGGAAARASSRTAVSGAEAHPSDPPAVSPRSH